MNPANKPDRPTIVVFTGNSNTGFSAIQALLAYHKDKVYIRAVVRSKKNIPKLKDLPVEIFESDLNKPQLHDGLFKGMVNTAYFATPQTEDRGPLCKKFIDLCAANGVDYPIILSVTGTDAKQSLFQKQMAEVEEYAAAKTGSPIKAQAWDTGKNVLMPIILRAPFFYQNLFGNAGEIKEKSTFSYPLFQGYMAHVDIDDIGKCVAAILANPNPHGGKTYNLIGEYQSGSQLASIFSRVTGKNVRYNELAPEELAKVLKSFGVPDWQANGILEHLNFFVEQGTKTIPSDIKAITGEEPTKFTQFVKDKMKPML